ncbi:ATP-dependent RNA helicase SrmB [Deinococcus xinjiangensis]|uniref:ATP-dependent RNA helicase SrmB n=1 Tax=Deinococcus xinjiangensis TaxID=457454 RepID=A0ABP9VH41_9DEIO
MTADPFSRLAPFIQEYIWQHGWTEIRAVQVQASQAIFDTDDHVLITSGTASGKTEAAFLPILTLLHDDPPASIGALYLGPLKALINDQFYRLEGLLEASDIPLGAWHGDIRASAKNRTVKEARGILQITPESLEALCLRRNNLLRHLFHDLRFVVIDEVHAFMGDERGRQVLCLLERLERVTARPPRRIGLSATLGDLTVARSWLAAGSGREVTVVQDHGSKRRLHLALEHFEARQLENGEEETPGLHEHLFLQTLSGKSLIFRNTRMGVEGTVVALRELAEQAGTPDIYHTHHGSVAASYREDAEQAMRSEGQVACTVATVTLELGIDLGELQRVLQVDPPPSVSSFVQRLGRTGRRGAPGEMILYTLEDVRDVKAPPHQQLPWSLLQTIATMQLYLEERWVEGAVQPMLPFSLLVHQTLAALEQYGELSPAGLAAATLTLTPFRGVTAEQYRALLLHLLSLDLLQRTDEGGLIIGLAGERIVQNWHFYAVFPDVPEYAVISGASQIGTLGSLPTPGDVISLVGRSWLVTEIDERRKQVFVQRVKGKANSSWLGGGAAIHDRVVQQMRTVLASDTSFPYLQAQAATRLQEARQLAVQAGLLTAPLVVLSDHQLLYLPWRGSRILMTLGQILALNDQGFTVVPDPSRHVIVMGASIDQLRSFLSSLPDEATLRSRLHQRYVDKPLPGIGKFDRAVPLSLLAERYVSDELDVQGACVALLQLQQSLDEPG